MSVSGGYRYPGARPFEDTPLDRQLFWGREREADRLLHLLLSERLVVLYGRSGVGKSSLVSAGLLDRLRAEGYGPVRIRLNNFQKGSLAPVFESVSVAAATEGLESVGGDSSSFWRFFKTLELWRGDELVTPVLVLDQFEELFTLHAAHERRRFINEFAGLVRGTEVDGVDIGSDGALPAVKLLISLREDFLPELEELAPLVPHILHNRFRLEPLSPENARAAITRPASYEDRLLATPPFSYSERAVDEIIGFLAKQETPTRIRSDEVEPFQLQIICQHTEQLVRVRHSAGEQNIQVDQDLGGEVGLRSILSRFYERQIQSLHPTYRTSRIFRLCETGLINPEGRRLTLEEGDIQRRFGVPRQALLELENRRILRTDPRRGMTYYELSHDSLVGPVRDARQERRQSTRRMGIALVAVIATITAVFIGRLVHVGSVSNTLEQQAAALADLSREDPTLALASAVSVLSRALAVTGVSPTVGEAVVRAADSVYAVETGRLPQSGGVIALSSQGNAVFVGDDDGTVRVFDTRGELTDEVAAERGVPIAALAVGPLTDRLAVVQRAAKHIVRLWSRERDASITLTAPFPVAKMAFSPDEMLLALLGESGDLALVDTAQGRVEADVRRTGDAAGRLDGRAVLAFRGDGQWLAATDPANQSEQVRLWFAGAANDLRPSDRLVSARLPNPLWVVSPDRSVLAHAKGMLVLLLRADSNIPIVVAPMERDTAGRHAPAAGDEGRLVSSLALSMNGAVLAIGHGDGRVRTFDLLPRVKEPKIRATFRAATSSIEGIALSPDGRLLATVSTAHVDNGTAVVWTSEGSRRGAFEPLPSSTGDQPEAVVARIRSVLFHPDPNCGIVATGDEQGAVRFWRMRSERPGQSPEQGGAGEARAATAISLDGPIDTGIKIERPREPVGYVLSMASGRDEHGGEQLMIGDDEGRLELWAADSALCSPSDNRKGKTTWRQAASVMLAASANIDAISVGENGTELLARVLTDDGVAEATVWQTQTMTLVQPTDIAERLRVLERAQLNAVLEEARQYRDLGSDDFREIQEAVRRRLLQLELRAPTKGKSASQRPLLDAATSEQTLANSSGAAIKKLDALGQSRAVAAAFASDGEALLIGDQFGNWTSHAVDLSPPDVIPPEYQAVHGGERHQTRRAPLRGIPSTAPGYVVRHGTGAATVVAAAPQVSAEPLTMIAIDGHVWRDGGPEPPLKVALGEDTVHAAALHDRGGQTELTLVTRDRRLFTVQLMSEPRTTTLTASDPALLLSSRVLVPSVRGRKLVDERNRFFLTFEDGLIAQYEPQGHLLNWRGSIAGQSPCQTLTAVALSAHDRILVGCAGGEIHTYRSDLIDRLKGETMRTDESSSITAVTSSLAGEIVAAGTDSGDVFVWNHGRRAKISDAHTSRIVALALSPNQRLLATGGGSELGQPLVRVWNVSTSPTTSYDLRGHLTGEINYVEFSGDGRSLLTAGDDGTALIWDVGGSHDAPLHILRHGSRVVTATFVADGVISHTVTEDNIAQFHFWDRNGQRLWVGSPRPPDSQAPWEGWLAGVCQRFGAAPLRFSIDQAATFSTAATACRKVVAEREGTTEVIAAAALGDVSHLRQVARSSPGMVDSSDSVGRTALYAAAKAGHLGAVAYLVTAGANLDAQDGQGRTALMAAIAGGHDDIAALLARRGAATSISDVLGNTALHLAALSANARLVRLALTHGAAVEVRNFLGVTPLMNAAAGVDISVVEDLLNRGANVNAADEFGHTALMDASRSGSAAIVKRLLTAGADVDAQTIAGRPRTRKTALLWAKSQTERTTSDINWEVVAALEAKSPLVTEPLPQITVRFPLRMYLPQQLASMVTQLEPWNDAGLPTASAKPILDRLLAKADDDPFVQFLVGRAFEVGIGTDKNFERAQYWYERSVSGGDPLGKVALAMLLWNGPTGVKQDIGRVEGLLRELDDAEHSLGRAYYAQLLSDVRKNRTQARQVLQRAAESPSADPTAQNSWGLTLEEEGRNEDAAYWYLRSAKQNDVFGIVNYGGQILSGNVPGEPPSNAVAWFKRAAAMTSQGGVPQLQLGTVYEHGVEGVPATSREALYWYTVASQLGNPVAPFRVAWMLGDQGSTGAAGEQEMVRQFYRASVNGNLSATRKLMARGMKP